MRTNAPNRRCCNQKTNEDFCETDLDEYGDHAVNCGCGPLRIQRHDAYADVLADCVAETGAHVRREAWVGEMVVPESEAIPDIWAFGTEEVVDLLVDVTVCHPMAAKYQPTAANRPEHAACDAAKRKLQRYPATGGRAVQPFAIETWGRLESGAETLLETLSAAATRRATLRGQATPLGGLLKRWRAALDAVIQRGVANALISARCGLPGRRHERQRGGAPEPLLS